MIEITVYLKFQKNQIFLNDPRFNYIDRDESSTFTRKLFLESFHVISRDNQTKNQNFIIYQT